LQSTFTEALDKIFEELFKAVQETYLSLKDKASAKFKIAKCQLESEKSQINTLDNWSKRLTKAQQKRQEDC